MQYTKKNTEPSALPRGDFFVPEIKRIGGDTLGTEGQKAETNGSKTA